MRIVASGLAVPHPDKVKNDGIKGVNRKGYGHGGEDSYFYCEGKVRTRRGGEAAAGTGGSGSMAGRQQQQQQQQWKQWQQQQQQQQWRQWKQWQWRQHGVFGRAWVGTGRCTAGFGGLGWRAVAA